jgi:alkylation response protein AidB-like acyl-CoA dehydrogenase
MESALKVAEAYPECRQFDCVAVAKDRVPLVAEHEAYSEEHGHLHDDVVTALQKSGLFSVNVPDEYGGASPSPRAQCEAIIELSKADPSVGWCFMVSTGFNWQVGRDFGEAAMEKAFADRSAHVTGSFVPAFFGKPTEGGYIVSGESSFNSNVYRSGYKVIVVIIIDKDKPADISKGEVPPIRAMLLPASDCTVVENWDVIGLRGTGSHNVRVSDVFVPAEFTIDIVSHVNRKPREFENPIYRLPYVPWTGFHTAAVLIGVAERAADSFIAHTTSKIMLTNKMQSQATLPSTKAAIAEVATLVRAAKAHLLLAADESWEICREGRDFTLKEEAHLQMAAYHTSELSVQAVQKVFTVCGAAAISKRRPLEKLLRDVMTGQQHLSVSPDRSKATISRRLLGLPLESNQPFD